MLKTEVANDIADDLAELEFGDGDMELMYHEDERGRFWLHDVETFHKVHIDPTPGSAHVEFRMLTEDGVDVAAQPDKPCARSHVSPHELRFLAGVAFSRAVKFEGEPEWVWHATAVPMPATMNRIAERQFEPLGAHDLKLGLLDGDGDDRLFTPTAMVHAIADGFLPISTTARYFRHDMESHSVGMLALDAKTMATLQALCQCVTEVEHSNTAEATRLSGVIVEYLDYFTFEEYFMAREISSSESPLLEGILSSPRLQGSAFKGKLLQAARGHGIWFADDGRMAHNSFIRDYHRRMRRFFEANRTAQKN